MYGTHWNLMAMTHLKRAGCKDFSHPDDKVQKSEALNAIPLLV
jgi:hypothetical protein